MRALLYVVSAILVGITAAGLFYVLNSRSQRIEQRFERRMSSVERLVLASGVRPSPC
jgi:hypothetical protein